MRSRELVGTAARRGSLVLAALAAAAVAGPVASAAGLELSRIEDRILDPAAHARITYENTVNVASYQQDGVLTYNGYQYTAWYQNAGAGAGAATSVIARRELPDGDWESAHLDHPLWSNDSHNTIALGVTESDGRLHVTFPTHDAPVRYTRSVPGLLDDPEAFEWSSLLFDSVYTLFPGAEGAPQTFTYPQFENVGSETLVTWRDGITNNGRQAVLRYDNNAAGTWTFLGRFSHNAGGTYSSGSGNSATRYGYIHGFTADPASGDLAVTFSWREQNSAWCTGPLAVGNHDLGYAVSSDAAETWRNNDGDLVATTTLGDSSGTITPFTPGIIVEPIGINKGLINQETQAFDGDGRLHVVTSRVPDEDISGDCVSDFYVERAANARPYHHWRGADGTWHTMQLPFRSGSSGRTKIAFDSDDNAYVVLPDARIVAASAASGWTDWELVFDDPEVENVSETIIDRKGAYGSDLLTIAYQEPPSNEAVCRTNTTSSACASAYRIATFALGSDDPDAPRSTTPEAEPIPFEGYADDVLNLALNRSGIGLPEAYAHQGGFPPSQSGREPKFVNDGDVDTFWVSGPDNPVAGNGPSEEIPVYLGVDLGELHPLGATRMVPRPSFGPTNYTVEVSDEDVPWEDAEDWTEVASVTGAPNGPLTTEFEAVEARHLRLRITGSRDSAGQPPRNTQVAELLVFAGEVEDTTAPETTAALDPASPGPGGTYGGPVAVTLSASDGLGEGASGVDYTAYRVITDGVPGDWVLSENADGAEPFEAAFTVTDLGEHVVVFLSGDLAGNVEATKTVTFAITDEPVTEPPLLTIRGVPRLVKVSKRGKLAKLRFRATNGGGGASGPLTLCVKAPKRKLAVKGKACVSRPSLAPGQTTQRPVKLRVKPKARGKTTKVTLIARGPEVAAQRVLVRVKAKR